MHELEMWYEPVTCNNSKDDALSLLEKEIAIPSGYLQTIDRCKPSRTYFIRIFDHYMFLYNVFEPKRDGGWLGCFDGLRRHQTVPEEEHGNIKDLVRVIDLLQIKELSEHRICLDDTTQLETTESGFISTVFQHIQRYKENNVIKV